MTSTDVEYEDMPDVEALFTMSGEDEAFLSEKRSYCDLGPVGEPVDDASAVSITIGNGEQQKEALSKQQQTLEGLHHRDGCEAAIRGEFCEGSGEDITYKPAFQEDGEKVDTESSDTKLSRRKKKRNRSLEESALRKDEHKRWRVAIDGFAQYAEWVSKTSEPRSEESVPDLGEGDSVTTEGTEDPEAEYFYRAEFDRIEAIFAAGEAAIAKAEEDKEEEERRIAEADAKFAVIEKQWEEMVTRAFEERKKRHRVGEEVEIFICFACGKAFDAEVVMREHVNDEHLSQKKGYDLKCKHCYRRFKRKHHLQRHEATHDTNATFKCDRCAMSFRLENSLIVHRSRVHCIGENGEPLDEMEFKCARCSTAFGTLLELRRHKEWCLNAEKIKQKRREKLQQERSATPDPSTSFNGSSPKTLSPSPRPKLSNLCPKCNNYFASTQSLLRHIGRKHRGENLDLSKRYESVSTASTPDFPFACIECGKRFASHASLSQHKRRHAGDKPFECDKCGKSFVLASELRKHVARVHDAKAKGDENEKAKDGGKKDTEVGTYEDLTSFL